MKQLHRLVVFFLVALLLVAFAAPVAATEGSTEGETTGTTAVPELISQGDGPAVEAPPAEVPDDEQPWTVRFIYPVLVGGTVLLLVGVAIGYNRSVRKRYQVVS